jgi:hypothetical protein
VSPGIASVPSASSPLAMAKYVDTHTSTCQPGAPEEARDAYASFTVSGSSVTLRPMWQVSRAATSAVGSGSHRVPKRILPRLHLAG